MVFNQRLIPLAQLVSTMIESFNSKSFLPPGIAGQYLIHVQPITDAPPSADLTDGKLC